MLFLVWLRKLPEYYFLTQKINSGSFLNQKKQKKNMNHGSPLFPTIYTSIYMQIYYVYIRVERAFKSLKLILCERAEIMRMHIKMM